MAITETIRPPVPQQLEREVVTIFAGLKVTVVHQDIEHVRDATVYVVSHRGVQLCQGPSGFRGEHPLGSCFSEDFHGYRVAFFVVQPLFETCLVVDEIVVLRRPEKHGAINLVHILNRYKITIPHRDEVLQVCEKGLDVVRNAGTECFIRGVCHAIIDLQPVVLGKALETFSADFARPRSEAKGVEVVYSVGYAEPPYQRCQSNTAGCDENGRIAVETLKHPAQPAQEIVDPSCAVVIAEHFRQKNRKFVDEEENRLVVSGAGMDELFPAVPPVSGTKPGTDLYAKGERAHFIDLLGLIAKPAFIVLAKRDEIGRTG